MDMDEKYLIKNTTEEERRKIVDDALGVISGSCDGCMQGILSMYDPYIEGKMELYECNAAFHRNYVQEDAAHEDEGASSCAMD